MQNIIRSSPRSASGDSRSLRISALKHLIEPRVLCIRIRPGSGIPLEYDHLHQGFLLTVDESIAESAAHTSPSWAVYATAPASIAPAIAEGLGTHVAWSVLDIEAADPWPALQGYFCSRRPLAARLAVIVDDGLRVREEITRGGKKGARYLATCRDRIIELAATAGLRLIAWAGFHTGGRAARTHFAAIFDQAQRAQPRSMRSREIAASVKIHQARRRRGRSSCRSGTPE